MYGQLLETPTEFKQDWSQQAPISLLEDGDRRTFEGWAHVDMIDMEGMFVPVEYMQWSIDEYMRTNPVVLWLHNGRLPIGMITKMVAVEGKGVYVRGHIVKYEEIASKIPEVQEYDSKGKNAFLDIAKTADQVWNMLCRGLVRSLSIGSRNIGKQWEFREIDGVKVRVPLHVKIKEVSLAPIAQNRGSQITAANYLAKGLINDNGEKSMNELMEFALKLTERAKENDGKLPDDEKEFAEELLKAVTGEDSTEKEGVNENDVDESEDEKEDINELKKGLADANRKLAEFEKKFMSVQQQQNTGLSQQRSRQSSQSGAKTVRKPGDEPKTDSYDVLRKGLFVAGNPALAEELDIKVPASNPKFVNDMTQVNLLLGGRLQESNIDFNKFNQVSTQFLRNVKNKSSEIELPKS